MIRKLILPIIALAVASAQATEIPQAFSAGQKANAQQIDEKLAALPTAIESASGLALVDANGFVFTHYEAKYSGSADTDQKIMFVDSSTPVWLPVGLEVSIDGFNLNDDGLALAGMLKYRFGERWAVSGEIESFRVDFNRGFKVPIGFSLKGEYRF